MLFILRNDAVKQNLIKVVAGMVPSGVKEVIIRDHKTKRSLQQNAYYWTVVEILAEYSGYDKEDMHRDLAIRFLGPEEFSVSGVKYHGAKSTTKLNTKEFSDYLDKVIATAQSLELQIPSREFFGIER